MKSFTLTLTIKDEDTGKEASFDFSILKVTDRIIAAGVIARAISDLINRVEDEIRSDN